MEGSYTKANTKQEVDMDVANRMLIDGFDRVGDVVHSVLSGLSDAQLRFRPEPTANSIAWLVWHLSRIQDDHIADVAGQAQVWSLGWYEKFKLPFDQFATGYGQSAHEVAQVRVGADLLGEYFDAVQEVTRVYLVGLKASDYDTVVDIHWTPPVTLGVRLMSILSDDLQHAGQAAYIKGMLSV
jgi:uncharacterized damage-inducible protein DinB